MPVKPIPDGHHNVTPYLVVDGAAKALDFYKQAFGAEETKRMDMGDGKLMHAEIRIGDSPIMLADENPHMGNKSPKSYNGSPVSLMLYVPDVDATFKRAISAGAKERMPVTDQFYGDRAGALVDPFGHTWTIATHKEDVSDAEMKRRGQEFAKKLGRSAETGGSSGSRIDHDDDGIGKFVGPSASDRKPGPRLQSNVVAADGERDHGFSRAIRDAFGARSTFGGWRTPEPDGAERAQ
jgi:PhnB protein